MTREDFWAQEFRAAASLDVKATLRHDDYAYWADLALADFDKRFPANDIPEPRPLSVEEAERKSRRTESSDRQEGCL